MADRTPPPPGVEARADHEDNRAQDHATDDAGRPKSTSDPELVRLMTLTQAELGCSNPDPALHHHLGLLLEHRVGEARQALDHHLAAHRLSGGDVAHVVTLRRAFARRFNWLMVVRLCQEESDRAGSAARAARMQWQKGVVLEERLLEPARAGQCYRRAVELASDQQHVVLRLHRLLWQEGSADELVDLCKAAGEATTDPVRQALFWYERAWLEEERLGNQAAARRAYGEALKSSPTSVPAVDALIRLLRDEGRWSELVELVDEDSPAGLPGSVGASDLVLAATHCAHDLGDVERAGRLLHRALRGSSALAPTAATLVSAAPDRDGVRRLVEWTGRWAADEPDPARRARLLLDLGMVHDHGLGDDGAARRCFRDCLDLDPTLGAAYTALFRQLQAVGRWSEVADLCGRALAQKALSDEHRVWRQRLADSVFRRGEGGLGDDPVWTWLATPAMDEALVLELHARRSWWKKDVDLLADLLEYQADHTEDVADQLALLVERATTLEHHRDGHVVTRAWRRVLMVDPTNRAAREGLALRLLADAQEQGDGPEPGAWSMLLDNERDPALRVEPAVGRAYALEATGELWEAAVSLQEAADQCGSWLLWRELRRLHTALLSWDDVVRCLEQEAAACRVTSTAVETLVELADVADQRLRDDNQAERALARALELAPGDENAAERMERRLRESGRWEELVEVLSRREAHYDSLPALQERQRTRAKLLSRMAHILEDRLGDTAGAAGLLIRATDLWPQNPALWLHQAQLLGRRREAVDAAEALRRVVAVTEDAQMLYQANLAMGNLCMRELGQPERAVGWLQNALTLRPGDPTVLERMVELFEGRRDWFNLAGVLEQQLAVAEDERKRNDLTIKLSDVRLRLYGDPEPPPAAIGSEPSTPDAPAQDAPDASVATASAPDEAEPGALDHAARDTQGEDGKTD